MIYLSANPSPGTSQVPWPNHDLSTLFYFMGNSLWGFVSISFRFPVTPNIYHYDNYQESQQVFCTEAKQHPEKKTHVLQNGLKWSATETIWGLPGRRCPHCKFRCKATDVSLDSAPFSPVHYLTYVECFWLFYGLWQIFFKLIWYIFPKPRIRNHWEFTSDYQRFMLPYYKAQSYEE